MDDERLRAAARRIVRECAGVRPASTSTSRAASTRRSTSSCSPSSASSSARRPLVVMQSDEHGHRRLLELPGGAARDAGGPGSRPPRRPTSSSRCAWSTATRRSSPTCRRRSAAPRAGAASRSPTSSTTARGAGSAPTSRRPRRRAAFGLDVARRSARCSGARSTSTTRSCSERADASAPSSRARDAVRITSPKGTDVTMRIAGRPLDKDVGVVTAEAACSNLPAGEVCLAPLEDQADGTRGLRPRLLGRAPRRGPGGRVRARALPRRRAPHAGSRSSPATLAAPAAPADVIGELGIGLNPAVGEPCGYMLTDEKILGTIHIAVGDNRCSAARTSRACTGTCWSCGRPSRSTACRILDDGRLVV